MKLDIAGALEKGAEDVATPAGAKLAGLFFITGLASQTALQTLVSSLPSLPSPQGAVSVTLPVEPTAAAMMLVLAWAANLFLVALAARTLIGGERELLRMEHLTHRMGSTALNLALGSVAFALIFLVGLLLLVFPGLYLAAGLFLWEFPVATEDSNFVRALKRSWRLTEGNRLRMFAVALAVTLTSWLLAGIGGLPSSYGQETAGLILGSAGGAVATVFQFGALAEVYRGLKRDEG